MSLEENFFSACGVGNLVEGRRRCVIFEMKQKFILPFFLYSYITHTSSIYSSILGISSINTVSVSFTPNT